MVIDRWKEPWWDDYRQLLESLRDPGIPGPDRLNELLPCGAVSGGGRQLCFVRAANLPGLNYEKHIFETGEVSTREDSWHDLFNALVWCRLPKLKAAMNALHYAHLDEEVAGRRGPQRDALTLLDESGAVVVCRDRALLEALGARDWQRAFVELRQRWTADAHLLICGHALLEKLRTPYKAITAHALLIHIDWTSEHLRKAGPVSRLDETLAAQLQEGGCRSPADLSPLPLMGIFGWWPQGVQDAAFYADEAVFRPPPETFSPAPIRSVRPGFPSVSPDPGHMPLEPGSAQ